MAVFFVVSCYILFPIGSMYGIYANIWGILTVNVTIYTIHGSYGFRYLFTSMCHAFLAEGQATQQPDGPRFEPEIDDVKGPISDGEKKLKSTLGQQEVCGLSKIR